VPSGGLPSSGCCGRSRTREPCALVNCLLSRNSRTLRSRFHSRDLTWMNRSYCPRMERCERGRSQEFSTRKLGTHVRSGTRMSLRSTLDIHRSCPICSTTPVPLLSIPEQRDRGGFEKMYNICRTCDFAFFVWAASERERAPHSPRFRKLNEMKGVCFSASSTCPHQVRQ
jgi:hypothetical protein